MVETVPKRVVLDEELTRQRCVRVQRDGRRAIELFIGELTDRLGGCEAVLPEELNRFLLARRRVFGQRRRVQCAWLPERSGCAL